MKKLFLVIAVLATAITASAEVPVAQYANDAPPTIYWGQTNDKSVIYNMTSIPVDVTPVTCTSNTGKITTTGNFYALVPTSIDDPEAVTYSTYPGFEILLHKLENEHVPGYSTYVIWCGAGFEAQFNFRIRNSQDFPHFAPVHDQFLSLCEMVNEQKVTGDNFTNITATSSNPSVATVAVSGNTVKTTFKQMTSTAQEVTVTVTATTDYGITASKTYSVKQTGNPRIYWATTPKEVLLITNPSDIDPSDLHPVTDSFDSGDIDSKGLILVFVPKEFVDKINAQYRDNYGVLGWMTYQSSSPTSKYRVYYGYASGKGVGLVLTYNTSALTENNFTLVDGQPYTLATNVSNADITYTRTFESTDWQPLYLPFSMNYSDWSSLGTVAELTGAGDGVLEWTTLEEGSQTVAGRPYIFKPNAAGTAAFVVNDATLVGCGTASPVAYGGYTLSGTYEEKSDMDRLYILSDGNFSKASADEALQPYRIYIEAPAGAPSQLRMRVNGAEEAALQGDMDGDGKITMSDANIIVNMYLGGK